MRKTASVHDDGENIVTGIEKAKTVLNQLAGNAVKLKKAVKEGNLLESGELTGERVALIESLRELRDAKVYVANSDIKDEMTQLITSTEKDVSEAIESIHARLSALQKGLVKMREAKEIAAYKVQGGRYGY